MNNNLWHLNINMNTWLQPMTLVCNCTFTYVMFIHEKNIIDDGNQKFYTVLSFDFWLVLAILRRFLPLCVDFGLLTKADSCHDADFFSSYG